MFHSRRVSSFVEITFCLLFLISLFESFSQHFSLIAWHVFERNAYSLQQIPSHKSHRFLVLANIEIRNYKRINCACVRLCVCSCMQWITAFSIYYTKYLCDLAKIHLIHKQVQPTFPTSDDRWILFLKWVAFELGELFCVW